MNWFHAAILGLVEGITEYLPVSSTGHLIIASSLMGLDTPEQKVSVDAFTIVIQGGAILAVVGLYWPRFVSMLRGLVGRDPGGFMLLVNIACGFLPAAVLGYLFNDAIESRLMSPGPVVLAFAVGGLYMLGVEQWRVGRFSLRPPEWTGKELSDLRPHQAFFIGLLQCVAMWPGTSRSMMTITGGMLVGMRPRAAAEFSFMLGVPTLGGACVLSLGKNIIRAHAGEPSLFDIPWSALAVGVVVATLSAAVAVRWLVGFLNRKGLAPFGWYRLVLAAALLGLLVGEVIGPEAFEQPADGSVTAGMSR